ncbi:MAG: response regulator transcription factor [Bacteroidaceae bacterium]|nr:response regulator transcription factor [Bacteroidaceae bacterium]
MRIYKIDVNIVEDHTMLAEGLTHALNQSETIHVSQTFSTLEECWQTLQKRRPDVLLLDISMPDGDGIAFCQRVVAEFPRIRILAMTCHDEYSIVQKALDSGAHGYMLKSSSIQELQRGIIQVYQGEKFIGKEVKEILHHGAETRVFLTDVEQDILRLICAGNTNPEIAQKLYMSTETIKWYRKRLLAKFKVKNTVELVLLAIQEKLL